MFVFQRKEFTQLFLGLTLGASFLFSFSFLFFNFVVWSVDQLPSADHLQEDSAKFGYKAERDMKVKTFKHPSILLASCWYLIHNSGAFFGYFIGILLSDYCKTPQKIIFLAFSTLTSSGKATLRVVCIKMPQSTTIMLLNILH